MNNSKIEINREAYKYNEIGMRIDQPKPTKIIWDSPDVVEMTNEDGTVHTYSIIEILDGLTALARQQKENQ